MPGKPAALVERHIPIISLADFDNRREEIKAQLVKAAEELGFFAIVNHGFSVQDIENQFLLTKSFFDQGVEVKKQVAHQFKTNTGWEERSQFRPSTGAIDQKESISLRLGTEHGWPKDTNPEVCAGTKAYMEKCHALSMKILDLFEEDLGLPKGTFRAAHDPYSEESLSSMRSLHYLPTTETKENYWRNGPHTDISVLTLLFQREGEAGLEILPGREAVGSYGMDSKDQWSPVPAKQGPIICNIGDMMMYWSDDRFKSIFHRVVAYPGPQPSRYATAYFNHAMKSTKIQGPDKKYPLTTGADIIKNRMDQEFKLASAAQSVAA